MIDFKVGDTNFDVVSEKSIWLLHLCNLHQI